MNTNLSDTQVPVLYRMNHGSFRLFKIDISFYLM